MLYYIAHTNETGILVSLDQEKAFDWVKRSFLINLLLYFGFGPSFCNWISTLYNSSYMRDLVNDFLSGPVLLQRGVWQGEALSPMLYILYVEVLACKVRSSPDIEGFLLPRASGVHFSLSQYADDITNFVKPIPSLLALFETISLYEKGTGARLNLTGKLARMNRLALRELKR